MNEDTKQLLIGVTGFLVFILGIAGLLVFSGEGNSDNENKAVEACIKNSGVPMLTGSGGRMMDCKFNPK